MLENTEGVIKNWQSRETDNIGYTGRRQKYQQQHNMCLTPQANTTNVNKT